MVALYLLETSVLTRLHHPAVQKRVAKIPPEKLARSSLTDLEVGHSARNAAEWDTVAEMLAAFTELQLSHQILRRAREVQRELADRGLRGRKVPDLLIAATAEHFGATLLHYDVDFEHIASVTKQPHEWVIRRGAID